MPVRWEISIIGVMSLTTVRPAQATRSGSLLSEISQRAGVPIEVYAFIGSSPIRQLAEQWELDTIIKRSAEAIDVAVKAGLPVCYVTEDTTRSRPEVLATLFKMAVDHGASRLCLSDTVGHATPDGVQNLIALMIAAACTPVAVRNASRPTSG